MSLEWTDTRVWHKAAAALTAAVAPRNKPTFKFAERASRGMILSRDVRRPDQLYCSIDALFFLSGWDSLNTEPRLKELSALDIHI